MYKQRFQLPWRRCREMGQLLPAVRHRQVLIFLFLSWNSFSMLTQLCLGMSWSMCFGRCIRDVCLWKLTFARPASSVEPERTPESIARF